MARGIFIGASTYYHAVCHSHKFPDFHKASPFEEFPAIL